MIRSRKEELLNLKRNVNSATPKFNLDSSFTPHFILRIVHNFLLGFNSLCLQWGILQYIYISSCNAAECYFYCFAIICTGCFVEYLTYLNVTTLVQFLSFMRDYGLTFFQVITTKTSLQKFKAFMRKQLSSSDFILAGSMWGDDPLEKQNNRRGHDL